MLSTHVWAIARPEYAPCLKAANEARAAAVADAWRGVRRAVARSFRRRPRLVVTAAPGGEG